MQRLFTGMILLAALIGGCTMQNFYDQGLNLYHQGNLPAAKRAIEAGLKQEPNNPELLHALGVIYLDQGRSKAQEALIFVDKALALSPDNLNYLADKIVIQVSLGRFEEAAATQQLLAKQKSKPRSGK